MLNLAFSDLLQIHLPSTVALSAIALIGYLFGRRTRQAPSERVDPQLPGELFRAREIAKELQQIAQKIRTDVASHQTNIQQFNQRVQTLGGDAASDSWQELSAEAESLLAPTMQLASKLSLAYDQLRKQSSQLMNFANSRSDPVTGVQNRRGLEEQLEVQLALHEESDSRFALGLFSVELPQGVENGEEEFAGLLPAFVSHLVASARDTDFVARYSNDEFVVLMSQTSLAGAALFGQRLIHRIAEELDCIVCGGVVEVIRGDAAETLLRRADSALYSARTHGLSCLYQHNGTTLRRQEAAVAEVLEGDKPIRDAASCNSDELQAAGEQH